MTIEAHIRPFAEAAPFLELYDGALSTDGEEGLRPDDAVWMACSVDGAACGGFMVVPSVHGLAPEVNVLLTPPARGKLALRVAEVALSEYRKVGGGKLSACVYSDAKDVQLFLTACGFKRLHSVDEGATRNGRKVRAIYYESQEVQHG